MILLNIVRVLILTFVEIDALKSKPQARRTYEAICHNVTKDPLFENGMVVGKPWRTYYGWNIKLDELCMEVKFKYVNPLMVKTMKQDIRLKVQPPWQNAALFMSMGTSRGMVLFRDFSGIPGRFVGVPNFVRSSVLEQVPREMYKMTMKVLLKGRYLLMSDCTNGVTSLALRRDNRPKRVHIEAVAATFNFGDPFPACTSEPDPVKGKNNETDSFKSSEFRL